jgi:very-short-patch-repair endonuclease
LWFDLLQGYQPRFLKQRIIDRYIVDFYCAKHKLVIELDGDVHGTDQAELHDQNREKRLISLGLKVVRFQNEDVLKSFDDVVWEIDRLCGKGE